MSRRPRRREIEARILWFGLAALSVGTLQELPSHAGAYLGLLPPNRALVDEQQTMAFFLGPVVFQIQNKLLVIPFSRGDHPFDASICGNPDLSNFERKACGDQAKTVFLQIALPGNYGDDSEQSFVSVVTLGYRQNYLFDEGSVDEIASEINSWDGGRAREPTLDTKTYAAVRIGPNKPSLNRPSFTKSPGTTYFFVATGNESPHLISCSTSSEDGGLPAEAPCFGRAGFLVDDFPRDRGGTYPFTVQYTLTAAQIDSAPAIERAVVKAVAALPRARAPWPPLQHENR